MWRNQSLFGQTDFPEYHAAIITDTHASLADRIRDVGEHVHQTMWGEPVRMCKICHAELQAHEQATGCCADSDACCWRSLSERCCW